MTGEAIDDVDSISNLPDAVLHIILSAFPTKSAIRTSVLSKRWRHVWSEIPSLSIDSRRADPNSIIETLTRCYSGHKITSLHLCISDFTTSKSQVDSLIEFAISHNTENLSLWFPDSCVADYEFPGFFYTSSSLKQLLVELGAIVTIPTVSWTSLMTLSLSFCELSDESVAKILSGSPLLESLILHYCDKLKHLDLSKSLQLRRLDIDTQGRMQIVAPHIHYLRLKHSNLTCCLVNVYSLIEADLNMSCTKGHDNALRPTMIMKMLEMLQNVKMLSFGTIFLQMLSLAELCGDPFPTLKVEVLTLETVIDATVIPGIAKLLQTSPRLKKLNLHVVEGCNILWASDLNNYLEWKRLDTNQCWKPKDWVFPTSSEPKLTRFMEFLLKNIGDKGQEVTSIHLDLK